MRNKRRTFFETARRFFYPFFISPGTYLMAFFVFIIWYIPGIINVVFLEKIISSLSENDKTGFYSIISLYIVSIIIYDIIFFIFREKGWPNLIGDLVIILQDKYLKKYIKFDNNSIETIGTGKSIAIISKGFKSWTRLTHGLLESIASILISFLFVIYMVSKISIVMPFMLLGLMVIGHIISVKLNRRVISHRNKRIEQDNLWTKQLVKILMSKFEIFQSNKIATEIEYLKDRENKKTYYNRKMAPYLSLFFRLPDWIINIILIFIFLYFGNLYFIGELDISLLVGISGALILMQKVLYQTVNFYKDFTKEFSEVEVLWRFFDETPEIKGYEEGKKFKYKSGNIEIKDLTYGYSKNKLVFNNFDLKIKGEKITALVGNSGSGKSTLVKLISGYIKANSGDILIDKQSLSEISLKSYYKDIGYLTQEPSVFDGSVLDNLTYAIDRKLKKGELEKVIEQSKCDFIYDLVDGINTEIGERGIRLSGGEKQRLAIAKIFLKNPKIILLDEPTSALDSFSEELITKAMHNLFKGRTIIIIAHRLQTVKNADDIILLEDGKIRERGTHKELVQKGGIYKKMLDLQSGF